jgi:hypothetical protein
MEVVELRGIAEESKITSALLIKTKEVKKAEIHQC